MRFNIYRHVVCTLFFLIGSIDFILYTMSNEHMKMNVVHTETSNGVKLTFTPLFVSTMTCVSAISKNPSNATSNLINIFSVAKYLDLDSTIVGIKLVYAAGRSSIIRGTCRLSRRKKDFYNQVTFNVHLNGTSLLSYKLFHNGAIQLTGAHSVDEAAEGCNYIISKLSNMVGFKEIELASIDQGLFISHDHLIYSWNGHIIGYLHDKNGIYMFGEYLEFGNVRDKVVLVSKKWVNHAKGVYSLDGISLGKLSLSFRKGITKSIYRKSFEIIKDRVSYRGQDIGSLNMDLVDNFDELVLDCFSKRERFIYPRKSVIHDYSTFRNRDLVRTEGVTCDDIRVYNLNSRFESNFRIYRDKLHECFIKNGYVSRWNSETHLGVNLRYHYLPDTTVDKEDRGICRCAKKSSSSIKNKCSHCKVVSLLCFVSGKFVLTGTKNLVEAQKVADFISDFYTRHYDEIRERSYEELTR